MFILGHFTMFYLLVVKSFIVASDVKLRIMLIIFWTSHFLLQKLVRFQLYLGAWPHAEYALILTVTYFSTSYVLYLCYKICTDIKLFFSIGALIFDQRYWRGGIYLGIRSQKQHFIAIVIQFCMNLKACMLGKILALVPHWHWLVGKNPISSHYQTCVSASSASRCYEKAFNLDSRREEAGSCLVDCLMELGEKVNKCLGSYLFNYLKLQITLMLLLQNL